MEVTRIGGRKVEGTKSLKKKTITTTCLLNMPHTRNRVMTWLAGSENNVPEWGDLLGVASVGSTSMVCPIGQIFLF